MVIARRLNANGRSPAGIAAFAATALLAGPAWGQQVERTEAGLDDIVVTRKSAMRISRACRSR